MAETRMNPIVKYLLIAIAILLQMVLVAGISIFVFMKFQAAKEGTTTASQGGTEIKSQIAFDEFKFPSDDGGLCSFKMTLDLSDEDIKKELEKHLSFIRDHVPRIVMKYKVDQIKEYYIKGKLHSEIKEWFDLNILTLMPRKKTWMFGSTKTYEIVRVNLYDLAAMKLE